jgi:predicted GIY-YIG superfamily endonuclease
MCAVYLLHFERKLAGHAGHYCGYTSNLRARVAAHEAGDSAKLIEAITRNDIRFVVCRVWPDGDRDLERKIKQANNGPRFCPICCGDVPPGYAIDVKRLTFQRAAPALESHQGKRRPMK